VRVADKIFYQIHNVADIQIQLLQCLIGISDCTGTSELMGIDDHSDCLRIFFSWTKPAKIGVRNRSPCLGQTTSLVEV
jgi:hypothetical protein